MFVAAQSFPYIQSEMVDNGEELRNRCLLKSPDVVFTDIRMPRLGGLEAIDEIRHGIQSTSNTAFYVITGYDDFEYALQALRLGVKDYILKPIKYTSIAGILESEEKARFLGLPLEKAWQMGNEEAALELSLRIQDLAAAWQERGRTYYSTLKEWAAAADGIPMDGEYFHARFGQEIHDYDQQMVFFEKANLDMAEDSYSKQLARKVADMVAGGYTNPSLGLDGIAETLGYSAQYLSTIFKREEGMAFSVYLTKVRMDRAKQLLTDTKLRIKDIAEACGYSYTSYFIKVFRKQTGKSPEEWRSDVH